MIIPFDSIERNKTTKFAPAKSAPIRHPSDPNVIVPRGLARTEAAYYVGVSPSLFDQMVADGRMPRPKTVNSRVVWDRWEIDAAFTALRHENAAGLNDDDGWGTAV